ncbi:MAG: hypothetical protein IKP97_04765 [Kiritimatiellae bacterium]|nr:hypothetical protein [Kiritimatiellia bacterium]
MIKRIAKMVGEALPLLCMVVICLGAMIADVMGLHQPCEENGVVEWCQFLALAVSGCALVWAAFKRRDLLAGLLLAGVFFLDMAIREQDALFDKVVHGFWVVPVGVITVAALVLAVKYRTTILDGLEAMVKAPNSALLMLGVFTILGFSRVIGYKKFWKTLAEGTGAADGSWHSFKRFTEESVELFGYMMVLVWAIRFVLYLRQEKAAQAR